LFKAVLETRLFKDIGGLTKWAKVKRARQRKGDSRDRKKY
jgi:hypothetical protein